MSLEHWELQPDIGALPTWEDVPPSWSTWSLLLERLGWGLGEDPECRTRWMAKMPLSYQPHPYLGIMVNKIIAKSCPVLSSSLFFSPPHSFLSSRSEMTLKDRCNLASTECNAAASFTFDLWAGLSLQQSENVFCPNGPGCCLKPVPLVSKDATKLCSLYHRKTTWTWFWRNQYFWVASTFSSNPEWDSPLPIFVPKTLMKDLTSKLLRKTSSNISQLSVGWPSH